MEELSMSEDALLPMDITVAPVSPLVEPSAPESPTVLLLRELVEVTADIQTLEDDLASKRVRQTELQKEVGTAMPGLLEALGVAGAVSAGKPARKLGRKMEQRYALVYKADGSPVLNREGEAIVFARRANVLRGPLYEELLAGDPSKVALKDNKTGTIVVPDLTIGPAPGRVT